LSQVGTRWPRIKNQSETKGNFTGIASQQTAAGGLKDRERSERSRGLGGFSPTSGGCGGVPQPLLAETKNRDSRKFFTLGFNRAFTARIKTQTHKSFYLF
jgi:hypothetical protein